MEKQKMAVGFEQQMNELNKVWWYHVLVYHILLRTKPSRLFHISENRWAWKSVRNTKGECLRYSMYSLVKEGDFCGPDALIFSIFLLVSRVNLHNLRVLTKLVCLAIFVGSWLY
jgi:hypothetical protein